MTLAEGYFNAYNAAEAWETDPGNMTNGTFDSYAATTIDNNIQELTGNSCPTDEVGGITKVEIRLYGYGDGDDQIFFTPVFSAGDGTSNEHTSGSPAWSSWIDITSDTNSPELAQKTGGLQSSIQGDTWRAQSFIPHSNLTINHVLLELSNQGTPSGDLVVSIRSSLTGGDLTSGTTDPDQSGWINISLTEYTLTKNTTYYIVVRCPDGNISNKAIWLKTSGDDTYPYGVAYVSGDGGSSWDGGDAEGDDHNFDFEVSDWSWTEIYNLDCDVEHNDVSKGNTSYVGIVELQVTYTVGVQAFYKSFDDTLDMSDNVSRKAVYKRSLNDVLSVDDTLSRKAVYKRSLSDTLSITDSLSAIKIFLRTFSDTLGMSDSLSKKAGFPRSFSDTLDMTDGITRHCDYLRSLSDTLDITDSLSRECEYFRTLSDTLDITDNLSAVKIFLRSFSDILNISDSLSRECDYTRSFSDTLDLIDSLSRKASYLRSLSDTLGITDSATIAKIIFKTFTDTLNMSDSLSRKAVYQRSLSDTLDLTDSYNRQATYLRTLSDTLGITDSYSRQAAYLRTLSDTLGITDNYSRRATYLRSLTDTLNLTDNYSRKASYLRTMDDTLSLSDDLSVLLTLMRNFSDTLGITDSSSYIHTPFIPPVIPVTLSLPLKYDLNHEGYYKLTSDINSFYQIKKETNSYYDMIGTNENIYKHKHKKNDYYKMTKD